MSYSGIEQAEKQIRENLKTLHERESTNNDVELDRLRFENIKMKNAIHDVLLHRQMMKNDEYLEYVRKRLHEGLAYE